ncbi:tripartite tricarboxylate transporter TctB family protein [Micromonospora sp. DR5-3]|uniref:tripartite tricarboxylate transporter TctB family protein n=1 Tax=unclassified Micromonospora TaxID=2617518 RepID=UPI0011D65FE4|nr:MULTISPECIES: tripartite tricarboxylate transporter TctB family protein [unclassified Micromonospora]MCW3812928.1 tripartite tricarboxylate transporter TctB family protein [Micromonospora sp. DR5-3]TYC26071.1 tripartite tricarboxylate transporter TctB family protein [Micromonospora sp. MP36]
MTGRTTRPDRGGDPPSRPAVPTMPDQAGPPDRETGGLPPVPAPVADPPAADPAGSPAGSAAPSAGPDGEQATARPDRAQYGVCAFLALVGGFVIIDALRVGHAVSTADPIGPKPVPILLGVLLLIVAAIYAVDVARGGAGEPEAGEDVDLATPIDWRTVLLLIGAFVVNAVLIDRLGWVISGTILFWGSAYALGNRHYFRNLLIAVALSLVTFYTFAIGLGVNLPAGVLQGIL